MKKKKRWEQKSMETEQTIEKNQWNQKLILLKD